MHIFFGIGCSDKMNKFHPGALSIASGENKTCFEQAIQVLHNCYPTHKIEHTLADACERFQLIFCMSLPLLFICTFLLLPPTQLYSVFIMPSSKFSKITLSHVECVIGKLCLAVSFLFFQAAYFPFLFSIK